MVIGISLYAVNPVGSVVLCKVVFKLLLRNTLQSFSIGFPKRESGTSVITEKKLSRGRWFFTFSFKQKMLLVALAENLEGVPC